MWERGFDAETMAMERAEIVTARCPWGSIKARSRVSRNSLYHYNLC